MRWLQFILSHSIFISLCAAALCFQTHILLSIKVEPLIYLLVFSATLSGYNLYWLISKYHFTKLRTGSFLVKNISNILVFCVGMFLSAYCILMMPFLLPPFAVGVMLTLLYSLPLWPIKFGVRLQQLGFLKTTILALTWTYITVMLPATNQDVAHLQLLCLFFARFFFMLMLCAIFDSRDIAVDKINQLRSLATDVAPGKLRLIMILAFTFFICAGFFLRFQAAGHEQLWAFLITGIVTLWVYKLSLKRRGYFFYYFVVDGLMLFSSALTFVASIG